MRRALLLLLISIFSLSVFAQLVPGEPKPVINDSTLHFKLQGPVPIDSVIAYGKYFLGKPYRYKTPSGAVFDCSGFLSYIFGAENYTIPHNSGAIFGISKPIDLKDVKKGDVLFFKGRNIENPRIGHVSLVVDVNENGPVMMHSSRRGVVIDNDMKPYYKARFLHAGRLPFFNFDDTGKTPVEPMLNDSSSVKQKK